MKFHSSQLHFFNRGSGAKGLPPQKLFPVEINLTYGPHAQKASLTDYVENASELLPEKIFPFGSYSDIVEVEVLKNTGKVVKFVLRLEFGEKTICLVVGLNQHGNLGHVYTIWSNHTKDKHITLRPKVSETGAEIPWSCPKLLWR